jgi:acetolactate synthase-1/2/3 large subunit
MSSSVRYHEAAQAVADLLDRAGVRFLFTMPGDAFSILEACASASERGSRAPKVVTCLHELVAVAAADGYHMVSGIPQACLLHVDVGMQMAGGMVHNAQRGRAGMLIMNGQAPATWDGSLRGGREFDLHWIQDRCDLGGAVRQYVKWSYDVQRVEPLVHVLQRALQVAASEPAGPVYVSLLREMLMEPLEVQLPDPSRHRPPAGAVPESGALEELADCICAAERPVIVAGHAGRDPRTFAALAEFAAVAAAEVYSHGQRANIATDHPMYLGSKSGPAISSADLVLFLDVDVPWVPMLARPREGARVARIDIDPLRSEMGLWTFPCDLLLQGSVAATLPVLTSLVAERRTAAQGGRAQERARAIERAHSEWQQALATDPSPVAKVAQAVAGVLDETTIVVDDSTCAIDTNIEQLPVRAPGSYYRPMGSSMGWGASAAFGAKLAAPDSTIISLNAEGNLLSGAPEAALWGAARHGAPFLTVVYDNAQYGAIRLQVQDEYPDGALLRSGTALDIDRPPDLVALAGSCDAYGERVEDLRELGRALDRGLDAVRGGQCALVDVVVPGP